MGLENPRRAFKSGVVDSGCQHNDIFAHSADTHRAENVLKVVAFVDIVGLVSAQDGVDAILGESDQMHRAFHAVDSHESTQLRCVAGLHADKVKRRGELVHRATLVRGLLGRLGFLCRSGQHCKAEET